MHVAAPPAGARRASTVVARRAPAALVDRMLSRYLARLAEAGGPRLDPMLAAAARRPGSAEAAGTSRHSAAASVRAATNSGTVSSEVGAEAAAIQGESRWPMAIAVLAMMAPSALFAAGSHRIDKVAPDLRESMSLSRDQRVIVTYASDLDESGVQTLEFAKR